MSSFSVPLPRALDHMVKSMDSELRQRIHDRLMEVAKQVVKEEAKKLGEDLKAYVEHKTNFATGDVYVMVSFNGEALK